MKAEKAYNSMLKILSVWEESLDNYSDEDFAKKPDADSWSMGQAYAHIIDGAMKFHLKQVEACLLTNENSNKKMTGPARLVFLCNSFPPIKIKVPPSKEYTPEQPPNRQAAKKSMEILKKRLKELSVEISKSGNKGKTQHPAFGYLNAMEWYTLIGLHIKHHLKQKKRIEKIFS